VQNRFTTATLFPATGRAIFGARPNGRRYGHALRGNCLVPRWTTGLDEFNDDLAPTTSRSDAPGRDPSRFRREIGNPADQPFYPADDVNDEDLPYSSRAGDTGVIRARAVVPEHEDVAGLDHPRSASVVQPSVWLIEHLPIDRYNALGFLDEVARDRISVGRSPGGRRSQARDRRPRPTVQLSRVARSWEPSLDPPNSTLVYLFARHEQAQREHGSGRAPLARGSPSGEGRAKSVRQRAVGSLQPTRRRRHPFRDSGRGWHFRSSRRPVPAGRLAVRPCLSARTPR
jgi:hypothetical protein